MRIRLFLTLVFLAAVLAPAQERRSTRKPILIREEQTAEKKDEKKYELKKFMDFFNQKRQFLGSYEMPENKTLAAIDTEGNFYFIQWNPYPKVIRSKLIVF